MDWLRDFRARCNAKPQYPLIIQQTMLSSVSYPCIAEGCPAGISYVHLRANGDVSPCDFCEHSFGNIRQHSLAEIWRTMIHSSVFRKASGRCRLAQPEYLTELDELAGKS